MIITSSGIINALKEINAIKTDIIKKGREGKTSHG